ncbi:MAG: ABC transporter substrate-binding protein [Bacillota bacterium]|nr:ABC transporter substrate-binding protein [Bacillota bacterium]
MRKLNKQSWLRNRSLLVVLSLMLGISLVLSGCSNGNNGTGDNSADNAKEKLVLADASWASIQVHNRIAGFILEEGYGYPVEYMFGETLPTLQGIGAGDIDVLMEVWADNYEDAWNKLIDEGSVINMGSNFPDSTQGWYVPTYMIKGDPERGIEPITPDLKSISDLPKYWEVFKDQEVPTKGRFYQSPAGWACTEVNEEKFVAYGLDKTYNLFASGSQTALATSMVTAYDKGEPWLGYYWEPTWVMGKMDMTLLEETAYDKEIWDNNKACAYPPSRIQKAVNKDLENNAPEVFEFVKKYETTTALTNKALAYMQEHDGDTEKAAIWFLQEYPDVWNAWVPDDVASRVEQALSEVE